MVSFTNSDFFGFGIITLGRYSFLEIVASRLLADRLRRNTVTSNQMMKKPNLSIDVSLVNGNSSAQIGMETTYRAEGLSIGRNCMRFEGKDISEEPVSIDQFIVEGSLGQGTSSIVKRAKLKKDPNKYYALKIFPLNIQANQDVYEIESHYNDGQEAKKKHSAMLVREIKLMCQLECECLVQMVGAFYDPGVNVTMVLEYMDYGSLDQYLNLHYDIWEQGQPRMLPEFALAAISKQILWGLAYLHHQKIIHRDIKPSNSLINSKGAIKISDLGISALKNTGLDTTGMNHTVVGTSRYMSPERILDKAYGPPSDIWSFGLLLTEVATGGWNPLDNDNSNNSGKGLHSLIELAMVLDDFSIENTLVRLSEQQKSGLYIINNEIDWSQELKDSGGLSEVLRWSLQRLPERRIPAAVLLDSPWFHKYEVSDIHRAQRLMQRYFMDSTRT